MIESDLQGLQEAQSRLARLVQRVGAGSGLRAIIARAVLRAHRYTTMIVHVDTGRLKNSLFPRVTMQSNQAYGVVGTNVMYAPYEHDRGGSHAFFERTVQEDGPAIVRQVEDDIRREVDRAGD